MNFIKQIFTGNVCDKTHRKFIKYGKGKFPGPVLEIKKQAKNIRVKGSYDYSEIFGKLIAENTDEKFKVTGKILSMDDLDKELVRLGVDVQKKSKKRKLKVYQIKTEVDSGILRRLYELEDYVLLSLAPVEKINFKLKSKAAPPKPGSEIDDNFCSAVVDISLLDTVLDELCFDVVDSIDTKNFKKINISHEYKINETIIPKGVTDPKEIRLQAKRKGRIVRNIIVDDDEIVKEGELLV